MVENKIIKIWYECWWDLTDINNDVTTPYFKSFCIKNNIELIISPNEPDIVLYSVFGNSKEKLLERIKAFPKSKKIFFIGEPDFLYPILHNKEFLNNNFDLIIGFERIERDKWIRVPLWIFFCNFYDDYMVDNKENYLTKFKTNNIPTKFCTMIARSDYSNNRVKMVNMLNNIERVDCPSSLNNNHPPIQDIKGWLEPKINFLKNYKINICPENVNVDGYVTEKLFQCLEGGCIPLYWGNLDPEPLIINKNKIIFYTNDQDKELLDKIKILNTQEGYIKYKKESFFLDTASVEIHNIITKLEKSFFQLLNIDI